MITDSKNAIFLYAIEFPKMNLSTISCECRFTNMQLYLHSMTSLFNKMSGKITKENNYGHSTDFSIKNINEKNAIIIHRRYKKISSYDMSTNLRQNHYCAHFGFSSDNITDNIIDNITEKNHKLNYLFESSSGSIPLDLNKIKGLSNCIKKHYAKFYKEQPIVYLFFSCWKNEKIDMFAKLFNDIVQEFTQGDVYYRIIISSPYHFDSRQIIYESVNAGYFKNTVFYDLVENDIDSYEYYYSIYF